MHACYMQKKKKKKTFTFWIHESKVKIKQHLSNKYFVWFVKYNYSFTMFLRNLNHLEYNILLFKKMATITWYGKQIQHRWDVMNFYFLTGCA